MRTWCRIIVGIMALIVGFSAPMSVYALSDSQMDFFAQNNILFYDPDNNCVSDADIKGDSDGSDVYMIGDFITANSEDIIKSLMPNITINAGDNASFSSGVSMVNNMGEQNILVFALGTNGGINGTESFLNAVSGKNIKVILMTIYNGTDENQMKGANNAVKNLAMQYDTITYIDWYSMASGDLVKYISADKIRPTSDGYSKFAKLVKESVDKVSTMNIPTNVGDGDYSRVLNAKNADKYVFNVANYSEWSARWGDGNVEQMTKVLNNYGDLAYQLGDAVGAPWIAIIVQMRYEDPNSVCGSNNFWGNGCPPGTPAGGSSIKAKNLGEGFVKYGKTLTNGSHNQALGISDPKEYLEKIGHSWVYGPNDPDWSKGYGSIDGMKKSVDALQTFVNSDEGQAIVKTFGNYHGTSGSYSSAMSICNTTSAGGNTTTTEPVFYQQGDPRWGSHPYTNNNVCKATIESGGCGPTSLASIIATLKGDKSVTPVEIADMALKKGLRAYYDNGSCWGSSNYITRIAEDYGLKVEYDAKTSIKEISDELRDGAMYHVSGAGSAPFTSGGHFIGIRGITEDGKWLVFDSNKEENNYKEWDPSIIFKNGTGAWHKVSL